MKELLETLSNDTRETNKRLNTLALIVMVAILSIKNEKAVRIPFNLLLTLVFINCVDDFVSAIKKEYK